MEVIEIITKYLKENGYDGLVSADGYCGCHIDDLCPCENVETNCEAGHKVQCPGEDVCEAGGGCDFHITA